MHIDIKIAVQPVVKAYLQKNFNVEPFELSQDNQYGIFLYNCLTHVKKVRKLTSVQKCFIPTANDLQSRYSEILTIRLTERTWRRKGSFIHPDMQTGFNRMVMFDLNDSLYLWVESRTGDKKITLKQAFLEFREKFGLTEDNLPLKTMEKKYERYRFPATA